MHIKYVKSCISSRDTFRITASTYFDSLSIAYLYKVTLLNSQFLINLFEKLMQFFIFSYK